MYKWFKWCISDLRSISAQVNARGYPCAKGCNSSASQWLCGEQVRLCSGHLKVHFGTIVEGSWGECTVGPLGSLTIITCTHAGCSRPPTERCEPAHNALRRQPTTGAGCSRPPTERCEPAHNALRRQPTTGFATIVTKCFEKARTLHERKSPSTRVTIPTIAPPPPPPLPLHPQSVSLSRTGQFQSTMADRLAQSL